MRFVMIALGALAFTGCNEEVAGPEVGRGPVDEPGRRVGLIVLQVEADTLLLSETTQLHPTVLGVSGDTLSDVAVAYTSSNEHILTVSSAGLVTAVGPGAAAVTARAEDRSATANISVAVGAMTLVSGDHQTGDLGAPLGDPLVIRVTDARGMGMAGVRVIWSVFGLGSFLPSQDSSDSRVTTTDDGGYTRTRFIPMTLGSSKVLAAADIDGVKGSPVIFAVDGILVLSDLPPFPGSSLIYHGVGTDFWGRSSDYKLNEDRTFEVEYSDGFNPTGTFSIRDKVITFDFGANELGTGILRGDSLYVKYNTNALIGGFEDGVYVR